MVDRLLRFVRLDIGLLLALAVVLVASGWHLHLTSAHAGLERSNPEADAVISEIPSEIELFFTQELDGSGTDVRVLDQQGDQVDNRDAAVDLNDPDRKRVTITVQDKLPSGTYTVQWVSLSAEDGEEELGSFSFTLQAADASPIASPASSPGASPAATPSQAAN